MAKTRTRRTTTRARKTKRKKTEPMISPEAKREIAGVVLAALTILLLFAVFNFGGTLVTGVFALLRQGVGYAAYLLPVIFGGLAVMLFRREDPPRGHNYFGFGALIVALSTLFHVGISTDLAITQAEAGNGGGVLGYSVSRLMLQVLNVPAASIVLVALVVVFLIVATNTNLADLFGRLAELLKPEPSTAQDIKVNDPTAELLKVNDNSGASNTLPVRGQLELGGPAVAKKPTKEEPQEALTAGSDEAWEAPSFDLLSSVGSKADAGDVKANAAIIQQTMESFNIGVQMGEVNVGPTVTQYTFTPPSGVKLNKITTLDTNLALSLAAHPIRIEAPIPGKSAVGVEIPNKSIAMVRLRGVLEAPDWSKDKAPLTFALGRDVSGIPMFTDLAKMPHMLIAGATGSGKSGMINALLTSLLYRNSPNDMKLILVDPKRVELGLYNDIPHLLTPVIVEPEKCISALKWAVAEMERRYKLLAEVGNRNIIEYNKAHPDEAMPYIVVVIDEMADLMVLAAADVESLIVRLAQMARAIGIHLVLATQRPSVDVITGIIKANIPARLAFSVASQVDSRTILDQMGAEKLLGKGDMLFMSPEFMKPRRIQGAWVDEKEVKAVTDYLRSQRGPSYNDEVLAQKVSIGGGRSGGGSGGDGEIDDDLFGEAAEAVIRAGKASTSMLQRRLRVGYARAARLIDLLEEQGVVGPADGARPRDVLVSSLDQVRGAGDGSGSGATMPAGVDEIRQAEPYDGE
ncbi:MAG TPA: DNA translocase FtsK 4TM domain-containing protein [Candidatus Saccharimonadia bacterium]|nr:DNA translocase FtsK 4TM domain-containing protein [Candidatus Saccharimonadia bacterium]